MAQAIRFFWVTRRVSKGFWMEASLTGRVANRTSLTRRVSNGTQQKTHSKLKMNIRMLSQLGRIFLLLSVAFIAFAGAAMSFAIAATPEVVSMSLSGLQRGTSAEIALSGARLADAHSLVFFEPGLSATNITKVDDNNIKVTVTATAEVPCDLHPFRIATNTGLSNMRLLNVSALASVAEIEPNSEFASAQVIPYNSTVDGIVLNEDVDYFAVDLKQGQTLNVELEGLRLSYMYDFFDPYVAIYDAKRFEMTASDDSVFLQQDCLCGMIAPADGRYVIEVRESSFGGNERARYRLHVGGFPRPISIVPSGGPPGQPLTATCTDVIGNQWQETFDMPAVPTPVHRIWSKKDGMQAPSPNYIQVASMPNVLESEPNSDYNALATCSPVPVAFNGVLEIDKDRDFWAFEAKKDQQLEIRVLARTPLRSSVDSMLQIYKLGGGALAGNDDSNGPDSYLSFKVPEDGKYALCIFDHLGRFGKSFAYRAEIQIASPEVATSVNEQERYVSQVVNVPKGARMAFESNVLRKFVGGEAKILAADLPPGMTQADAVCAPDLGTVSMLFRADAGAANTAKLVDLIASLPVSPELLVSGGLQQRTLLVRGQNNVDVWGRTESKLAVAICDAAPFDIEVVQPQVPLVRNGSMDLRINAKRNPGFDKPIHLRLLSAPPGLGYSAVSMPGDQSTFVLPLTANNGAAIRKWPLVVIATTDLGFGPIVIASEYVYVDITDSLFEFKFGKTMAEQGKPVDVIVETKLNRPIEGTLEVEILGVPPGTVATTPKVPFAADGTQTVFPLQIPVEVRAGNYKTIVCRATVTSDKGVITQVNGNGEIQIDVPIAPPAATVEVAVAAPAPVVATPVEPAPKVLTRLEQLKQKRGK
jgi:hypothetical protein